MTIAPTKQPKDLTCVILCGGMGYRTKSYGNIALLKMQNGISILNHIINNVKLNFPDAEIVVTAGFEVDKVAANIPDDVRIVENQLYEDTNVMEEIRLALNNVINKNVLFISGDLIFDYNVLSGINLNKSSIIVDNHDRMDPDEIGVTIVEGHATIFAYDLLHKWCHIAYLTGKEITLLKRVASNRDKNKWYFFEALNNVMQRSGKLNIINNSGVITRIINSKSIKQNENLNK